LWLPKKRGRSYPQKNKLKYTTCLNPPAEILSTTGGRKVLHIGGPATGKKDGGMEEKESSFQENYQQKNP